MTSTADRTKLFHSLHRPGPLVLPNAWDVASARIVEAAGAAAVATTSAGVAWALGAADGDHLDRAHAVDLVARIVAAVQVPVTADIESGFGEDPEGVAETVSAVVAAGASGVNIEDAMRETAEQVDRLTAAREAAPELYINARIDTYLRGQPDLDGTLKRAAAYLEAGASGIFVPGVVDLKIVTELVQGIPAPLNVLVWPGAPSVEELKAVGVARMSLGSGIAEAAYAVVQRSAVEMLTTGTYRSVADGLSYGELNSLLAQ